MKVGWVICTVCSVLSLNSLICREITEEACQSHRQLPSHMQPEDHSYPVTLQVASLWDTCHLVDTVETVWQSLNLTANAFWLWTGIFTLYHTGLCTVYFVLQYMTSGFHQERLGIPVAPRGCPLEMRPPLGLITNLPPYVLSPLSISSPALPAEVVKHSRRSQNSTKWNLLYNATKC